MNKTGKFLYTIQSVHAHADNLVAVTVAIERFGHPCVPDTEFADLTIGEVRDLREVCDSILHELEVCAKQLGQVQE